MPEFSVFIAGDVALKPVLNAGRNVLVWDHEEVEEDHASIPVALDRGSDRAVPVSVEIEFHADPGSYRVDLQAADTPQDKYFTSIESAWVYDGAPVTPHAKPPGSKVDWDLDNPYLNDAFIGRIEALVTARFVRLLMVTNGNGVAVTARIF